MPKADRVHSTPPTNTSAITIRAWTAITGEGTRLKREQLASEISHISDEQLRANLQHTMSKLFMFVVGDLEWDFLRAHGQRPEWIFFGIDVRYDLRRRILAPSIPSRRPTESRRW
jgi:hypothetical protein